MAVGPGPGRPLVAGCRSISRGRFKRDRRVETEPSVYRDIVVFVDFESLAPSR